MSVRLLEVRDLRIGFGSASRIVDGLDLDVGAGEAVALVGSSGAGKSLIARALVGLLPTGAGISGGSIRWRGQILASAADFQRTRGRGIAYVFQDAASSLHPLRRIGAQLQECLRVHAPHLDSAERLRRIEASLAEVGLDAGRRWMTAWPHQLSGGQRQRVMLALTLLPEPALLVADEPTSALDPVLARRVCDLLAEAAQRRNMGLLLISHDLPRVAEYCRRIYRLSGGRAQPQVEEPVQEISSREAVAPLAVVAASAEVCIEARKLSVSYASSWHWAWRPPPLLTLDAVSLALSPGQRLGVVGSSGSGKSTLARGLLGLMPARAGQVCWFGRPLSAFDRASLRRWRSRVQLVFQDPFRSLDPLQRVDHMLFEALGYADPPVAVGERLEAAHAALIDVGLDVAALHRYPSQFSGGQRQRLAIARALATRPRVLICDEATSALDHDTQAQILELLGRLSCERQLALLFISHDLHAVVSLCDSLMVLDQGRVVETGGPAALLANPASKVLRALIDALPRTALRRDTQTARRHP